jgi:hypothetical protein
MCTLSPVFYRALARGEVAPAEKVGLHLLGPEA